MAQMNSSVRWGYDALLELHDNTVNTGSGAALTVTTPSSNSISLQRLFEAYWDNNEKAISEEFTIVIQVTQADDVPTATYSLAAQVDSVDTFDDDVVSLQSVSVAATGLFTLAITRELIEPLADYDASFLRLNLTVGGGGSPGFRYRAWVAPVRG